MKKPKKPYCGFCLGELSGPMDVDSPEDVVITCRRCDVSVTGHPDKVETLWAGIRRKAAR